MMGGAGLELGSFKDRFEKCAADDAAKVWINGKLVHTSRDHAAATPAQYTAEVPLRKGTNTVVVKITNAQGNCGFYLRLEHTDGTAAVIDREGRISTRRESAMNH